MYTAMRSLSCETKLTSENGASRCKIQMFERSSAPVVSFRTMVMCARIPSLCSPSPKRQLVSVRHPQQGPKKGGNTAVATLSTAFREQVYSLFACSGIFPSKRINQESACDSWCPHLRRS